MRPPAATPLPPPLPYATPAGYSPHPMPVAPLLSPEHLQQIALAQKRAAKIRRAIGVARFDGWATAVFGAITVLGGMFGSPAAFILGAGMCIVAFVEFKGARRLKGFDPEATRVLGWNQVFFGALLLGYALFSLWGVFHNQSEISRELAGMGDLGTIGLDADQIERGLGVLVYGCLVGVAIFGQGGTALYYWSRRKHVEAYLHETPQWIIDAQRAGLPL